MRTLTRSLLPLAFLSATFFHATAIAATHPFSAQDLVTMQRLSDPQVAPDGRTVAFVARTTDMEANRGRTDLWQVAAAGGTPPRRLTTHEENDSEPRWAADGKSLYFLSTRSGSSQVWQLPLPNGEPKQITDLPIDVSSLLVAPDGAHLAFSLQVFVDCADLACTAQRLEAREKSKTTGQLYDQLFMRHWDTWKDGRRAHLFVMPTAGGTPRDLTRGMDADIPSQPFGGPEEIAFTPDGRGVVFAARTADREEPWSTDFDLYHTLLDGSAAPRNLTPDNEAMLTRPVFSPDGRTLAYLAMARPTYESDRLRLTLRAWPSGPERVLSAAWDASIREFAFAADGKTLYATARQRGRVPLFAIDTTSGAVRTLVDEGSAHNPAPAADGRIVFGRDHLRSPVELYALETRSGNVDRLTDFNGPRLAQIAMSEAEQFSFAGWNNETVYGYVLKPAGFEAERTYPVAFIIHGGPQGSSADNFHYRWNAQNYTGAGFGVVMIDFHGSTGYGQAFTDSIGKDWGGKPLEDLQKGLAAALERYPWLDGERVAALGASYGGYMINWIAGQWPERFRCLVNHDGVFDMRSMYYTTEELWFVEWEHGGPYFANPEQHELHNPVRYVDRWQTPMLVIHGARDYRVPLGQGLATFTALQRRGIPSQFLYFPDENHWVLKPHNSIQWHDTVIAWLQRWTE